LEPDRASARRVLALVHVARGEHEQAAVQLDHVLVLYPNDPTTALDRAALHLSNGEQGPALELIERILAADPQNARALELQAASMIEQSDGDG
ncbi:MAG: tetratricopeptide repeat protein, partial [Trebonia sp.]